MQDTLRFYIKEPTEVQDEQQFLEYLNLIRKNFNDLIYSLQGSLYERSDIDTIISEATPSTQAISVNAYLDEGNTWRKPVVTDSSWQIVVDNQTDGFFVKYSLPNQDPISWTVYASVNSNGIPINSTDIVTKGYVGSIVEQDVAQLWSMLSSLRGLINAIDKSHSSLDNLTNDDHHQYTLIDRTSIVDGQLLIGKLSDLSMVQATLTASTGIGIALGAGSITISNTDTGSSAVSGHEGTYDHTLLHSPVTAGTGIGVTGQEVSNTDTGSGAVSTHEGTYDHAQLHASGSDNQNLWATFTGDSGTTTANSTTDTLSIVGAGGVTTSISGDTLTITGSGGSPSGLEGLPYMLLLMGC